MMSAKEHPGVEPTHQIQEESRKALRQHALFHRLYQTHLHTIQTFREDLQKSAFDHFFRRLTTYPPYRLAFPSNHAKAHCLYATFLQGCRCYAAHYGRQHLHPGTKIRIFLVCIQPDLDANSFQEIVTDIAELPMVDVDEARNQLEAIGFRFH